MLQKPCMLGVLHLSCPFNNAD